MKTIQLGPVTDLDKTGSHGYHLKDLGLDVFVVRKANKISGFINSCPHTGGPLDWMPNAFLDLDRRYIQCATHDALFETESGQCIQGPCIGQALRPFFVQVENGFLVGTLNTD